MTPHSSYCSSLCIQQSVWLSYVTLWNDLFVQERGSSAVYFFSNLQLSFVVYTLDLFCWHWTWHTARCMHRMRCGGTRTGHEDMNIQCIRCHSHSMQPTQTHTRTAFWWQQHGITCRRHEHNQSRDKKLHVSIYGWDFVRYIANILQPHTSL